MEKFMSLTSITAVDGPPHSIPARPLPPPRVHLEFDPLQYRLAIQEMTSSDPVPGLMSTATLMRRVHDGDDEARTALLDRCLPRLRRWARGRIPDAVRGIADTDDLVQTTVIRTLDHLDRLEPGPSGSFLGYMRQILLNAIRDELRKQHRRPRHTALGDGTGEIADVGGPVSDPTVVAAYERGLAELTPEQRDAIVLRVEFGMTFPEIAEELGLPSANAARMRVSRGLVDLAERMPT
jgi:RNA polymerase sigma-70 factor (ECF subfamily)